MNIFIAGSEGFIGSYLTKKLVSLGHKVICFDLAFDKAQSEICECAAGNICDKETIIRALKDRKIDVVVNLAAKHHDFGISEEEFFEVNEKGTKNLTECAAMSGVKKFLFYSSVAVYGSYKEPVTEKNVPNPVSPYGKSKLAAEKVLGKWAEEDKTREVMIIRPVVVLGAGNYANMYHLIKKISDKKFVFIGKGGNVKSVACVENLAAATAFLLNKMRPGIDYFNYSDEPQMSIREIVNVISNRLGVRVLSINIPLFLALALTFPLDILQKVSGRLIPITANRIKKFNTATHFKADKIREAGFVQPISLEEGFKRTLEWFLKIKKGTQVNKKKFGCLTGRFFIIGFLVLSSSIFAQAAVNITIDGNISDWAEVAALGTDAGDMPDDNVDVKAVYTANDNDYLYLRADVYGDIARNGNHYIIYLDTDQNAGTGLTFGWWTTGADYRIYIDGWGMGLQKFMGSNPSDDIWGWDEAVYAVKNINIIFRAGVIECAVPRVDIEETETSSAVNVLFRNCPGDDSIPYYAAAPLRCDFRINIIPQPQRVVLKSFNLKIGGGWDISVMTGNIEDLFAAQQLQQELNDKYNLPLKITDTSVLSGTRHIILASPSQYPDAMNLCVERNVVPDEQLGDEGYFLEIFDDERIVISANTSTGIFYGMQTLRQLLIKAGNSSANVQGIKIKDWPDGRMRGMHFCGVNFSAASSDYVYDKIDKMAKYKMNTAVFGVNYYNLETDFWLRKKLIELFDYCRRRHIEPIPEMSTWSSGCEVAGKDLNAAEGIWIKNEQFVFVDNIAQAVISKDVMINNAGFEIDANGDDMPDGWNIYSYQNWALIPIGRDIYWHRDTAEKHSGAYSMKLISGAGGACSSSVLQSNFISVEPNTFYTLSYFSKKTRGSGSGYNLAMRISQFDQSNKYIVENYCGSSAVGDWGEERINFYTDENSRSIKIWVWLYKGKGTIWIDDLKLEKMNGSLRNILTTSQTDVVITNLDKTRTYTKGVDYNLVKGNLKCVYYLLDPLISPTTIKRIPTGAIGADETVLMNYDLFAQFHELSWKRPYCPSDPKTYEIISAAFTSIYNYLNPKYISIKMDELWGGMNRDSRCASRNLTNAELFADGINRLYKCIRAVDPDIKIMMWDDMLNPWHFGGRAADQKICGGKFGTTKEAIDLIPKDIIQMIWWYSSSDYKGKMANSAGYFTEKGFEYLVSPWYDLENIKLWKDILRKHRNSLGMIGTSWPGTSLKWQGLERTADYSWRYNYPAYFAKDKETDR